MIVTLELPPGTVIPERELIEKVGLGRTPVREALQRLSWEGFIEVRPRSGLKIANLRPEDFSKVMELRSLLEPRVASAATRFANDSHRDRIADCRAEMRASVAAEDMFQFLGADKTFDAILSDAAGNQFLTNIIGPLQTHARRFGRRFLARKGVSWTANGHIAVIDAFVRGDIEEAEHATQRLMAGMLKQAKDLVR